MIITYIQGDDVLEQLVIDRYINDKLAALMGDIYETLTGDNICDPSMDKKHANILLSSLLPEIFPKKQAFSTFMRVYHLAVSNSVMSVDPVAAYVLQGVLDWYDVDFTLPGDTERIKLEHFVYQIGKYTGLSEEDAIVKKSIVYECMEAADGHSLDRLLKFGSRDKYEMDALTKRELKKIQKDFVRLIAPLEDYIEAIRVRLAEEKEEQ